MIHRGIWLAGTLFCSGTAQADDPASDWAFKLTPSYYRTTQETPAVDVNLRGSSGPHALWIGEYRRGREFSQTRTGYEYTAELPFGKLVPSLQLATHGFAGGSVNAEVGNEVFALMGVGRTNTREYYNLNFDPNDSVLYGLGTRLIPHTVLSLFAIRDNRLHTGQTVTHLLLRTRPDAHDRWTIDLSGKHGRATPEDELVSGKAIAVTYDHDSLFVRIARDRKVNFSSSDQTRIALGFYF